MKILILINLQSPFYCCFIFTFIIINFSFLNHPFSNDLKRIVDLLWIFYVNSTAIDL